MSMRDDWSWSVEALYACTCGTLVATQRWRWIDREARPDLAARLRAVGPFSGACPRCRRAASGGGAWLEVAPGRASATLVLSADRRGDLIAALQGHLADVQARPERAAPWLLQPAIAFAPPAGEAWPETQPGAVALAAWPGEAAVAGAPARPVAAAGAERGPEEPPDLETVVAPDAAGQVPAGRADRAGARGQEPADRGEAARAPARPGRAPEPAETSGKVAGDRSERTGARAPEPARPTAPPRPAREADAAAPGRGREGSGPVVISAAEAGGEAARVRPGRATPAPSALGRAADEDEGRRARARAGEGPLEDTFPGRRAPRPPGEEERRGGADGRRADGEVRTGPSGQDAGDMSAGRGERRAGASGQDPGESGRRPVASHEAGESGRRPVVSHEAGESGRRPVGSHEAGESGRRPVASHEAGESGRRPVGSHEAGESGRRTGTSGQDAGDMAAGARPGGQEPEDMVAGRRDGEAADDGERSALRAAVARALAPEPAPPPSAPPRRVDSDSGTRPAAVLPAPRGRPTGEAAEAEASDGSGSTWSKRQVAEGRDPDAPRPRSGRTGSGLVPAAPPPPPRLTPEVQRASLASLVREGGAVQVTATLGEATARVWASAPVRVRPIHLRGLGYPLVGVRCVAEVGGEALLIDAVVDVGEPSTTDIFKQLAREFRVKLVLRSEGGTSQRELVAPELQRNAAACLESAQAQLGTGEFPPDAYRTAREVLAARSVAQRVEPARNGLAEEMIAGCRASAGAAWAALERLDQASRKDNLARLLEVDGLPVETYEALRSAVLAAAIEFGLPAPARFWRRWLASEQSQGVGEFVHKLIAARGASIARGEDLTPEQVEAAWRGILDLCQHKDITPPPELAKALGIGPKAAQRRSSQAPVVVSGEIRDTSAPAEPPKAATARRKDLAARLQGSPSDGDIRAVIGAMPELSEEDLAGLLPTLAELGARIGPELVPALRAPQRAVRQAAAILLGQLVDRKAEGPLIAMLGEEPTAAWIDAARALGNFGPRVVGPLCSLLRAAQAARKEALGVRVARALAELVKAEGDAPGPGRQAVENLLDVGDASVSSAARRALATLGAVRDEGAGDEAEASRRFATLAYEAITAPELDAFADDEIDELDVEVGDD